MAQRALNSHAAGYEAIHPELKGLDPEDYPDINKLAILADVAPYSREYNIFRQKVAKEAADNTELQIEYEKILNRVKQTRDSVIRMENRRFTAPVDEVEGTVESVSPAGITLKEFPGRRFQFSSVGMRILGENNNLTRSLRPAGTKNSRARAREGRLAVQNTYLRSFDRAFIVIPKMEQT